jgi:hypothetical protein
VSVFETPAWTRRATRVVVGVILVACAGIVAGWRTKGDLPPTEELDDRLLHEPTQVASERQPFSFSYAGNRYLVTPVADYELFGLVVTHNDIDGLTDAYHDETSVDTKDLCVLFGDNLRTSEYQQIEFWSTAWTCHWRYPGNIRVDPAGVANNHLITASDEIRERIDGIRVGDQVHVRGSLVNYALASAPQWPRRTSQTRDDVGQGACEVIFVDELRILQRGTPVAYALWSWSWRLLWVALAALAGVWLWEASPSLRRRVAGGRAAPAPAPAPGPAPARFSPGPRP